MTPFEVAGWLIFATVVGGLVGYLVRVAEDAVRGQHEDALRVIGDRWREGERRRLR